MRARARARGRARGVDAYGCFMRDVARARSGAIAIAMAGVSTHDDAMMD